MSGMDCDVVRGTAVMACAGRLWACGCAVPWWGGFGAVCGAQEALGGVLSPRAGQVSRSWAGPSPRSPVHQWQAPQ
jgi:hypothetical protein